MVGRRERLFAVWRRTVSLSWPIAVQQTFNTLMRTVDIVVTGLFSPAAVAAVGLADLYAQVPLRLGLALGTGAVVSKDPEVDIALPVGTTRCNAAEHENAFDFVYRLVNVVKRRTDGSMKLRLWNP